MSAVFPSSEVPFAPGRARPGPTTAAILFVGVLCMLVLVLHGWSAWNSHGRRLKEGELAAGNLAQAAARQADEIITTADLALAGVMRQMRDDLDRSDVFGDLADVLAAQAATLPQVAGLFIFNETGGWVANSLRTMPKDANNAGRDYFIYHRDHADQSPYIGPPIKSRVSGEWVMTVSRRISRPDGGFAGVVLATIPLSYLRGFHQQLDTGRDGEIAIMRNNGAILARHPFVETALGANASASGLFRAYLNQPKGGLLRERSMVDGVERVYAYRSSGRYPIVALAAVSYEAWFAPWTRDVMLQGAAALALALIVAVAGAGFVVQQRRNLYLEQRLRGSERRLNDLADNLPLLALRLDAGHRLDFYNAASRAWFNVAPDANRQPHLEEVAGAALYEQWRPMLERALAGERVEFDCVAMLQGQARSLRMVCMPDRAHDAPAQGILVLGSDITALKASERRLRAIADNTPAMIAFVDAELRFAYSNGHGSTAAGIDASQMLGRTMEEVYGAAIYSALHLHAQAALAGERVQFECSVEQRGERRILHHNYIPEQDDAGRVIGFYALTTDVTAFKEAEQKLSRVARFDALTGLPNRSYLNERLSEALQRSDRNGRPLALLRIEIDRFGEINDSLGHLGGDAVLKELAARLAQSCRSTDMVARLGGNEFVILMEGLAQADESRLVAGKVVEAMRQPFMAAGAAHELAVTVGIALRHREATDPDTLLRQAGAALRAAKEKETARTPMVALDG
jgi:diguanylate cyclase (GGDEF)-like protein/PAS domain S-box-containing protein